MNDHSFFMTPQALARLMGGPDWPQVVDLRLDNDFAAGPQDIPCSIHRAEADFDRWTAELSRDRPLVLSCQRGLKVTQAAAARLRADGWRASVLEGGFVGWRDAGLPLIDRKGLEALGWREGAAWVTRRRPKIDRAACPWLIRRFVDPRAAFLFCEPDQVEAVAARTGGIAYDIPAVAASHVGEDCSFDTILRRIGLADWAPLARMAAIVRGADNARFGLAAESAGLLAVSLGLSDLAGDDDHGMIRHASVVYDGIYAWAARASDEAHNWPPRSEPSVAAGGI